ALGATTVSINYLTFEPGARSRPHQHDADQILVYTEGPGIIAVDGGDDVIVEAGDFVLLPANVVHMHGAPEGTTAAHISLMPTQHTTEWDPEVPAGWVRFVSETPLPADQLRTVTGPA